MVGRSFGGYSFQQRLGVGAFGELYRGRSGAGREARIIRVKPELAARPAFARALARFGEEMAPLDHPRVVGVAQVGRSGDDLVVVTDAVSGPVAVDDLIARKGRLPVDVALAIGLGAVEGLAHAHRLGVVHGAVHPRSLLVDDRGGVRLGDFGVAWALVETAAETDDTDLLTGLRGYLAPELALQQSASEASDVYAAGALLFELLHGEPPAGEPGAPGAVERVIARALSTDPETRPASGRELEELLDRAIAGDGCRVATDGELAALVDGRPAAPDDDLHAATDELVAELSGAPVPDAGVPARSGRVTDLLAELESVGEGRTADDIDDIDDIDRRDPVVERTDPAIGRAGEVEAEDRAAPRDRASGDASALVAALPPARRSRAFVWIAATVFAGGALAAILYTRTDLFDPGRKQAEEREAAADSAAALARHEAAQPQPVEVTVTAAEPDAAVWLLLGRTPLDSLPLSSAMVHELRVEHEGYQPLDVRVTGYQWKEQAGTLRAEVEAVLVPGTPPAPVPAFPPAPAGTPPPGPRGRGVVHVRSDPAGAQVWLLIGFTPRATITGLEAGQDYELKVLKQGFRPGFTAIRAGEWYLSGRGGPLVTGLSREVTLSRAPSGRPGKSHMRGRKGRAARDRP